jgi:hypothetical protein
MNWIYSGAIVLVLLVGIPALWLAFSNPKFVYGLFTQAASALLNALLPALLKPETPEARAKRQEAEKRDEVVPTKQRPHPNEGGHR